ncbi:hypothetical protein [Spirosoma aureum]|uniref:hypothetical protein n=1 Tax=Spirosoma aureum TaxID=2692134 RepID=UPI001E55B20E|nr:hypothetical protein [Spirosoma aureum]
MAVKPAIYLISLLIGLCTWVEAQPYVAWVKHYGPEEDWHTGKSMLFSGSAGVYVVRHQVWS